MGAGSVSIPDNKELEIIEAINAANSHYNIVILYGPHGCGKTSALKNLASAMRIQYINVGERLSELLKEITPIKRSQNVQCILESLLEKDATTIIDNTEILFNKELHQNVPALLRNLGRKRTSALVVSIPGSFTAGKLFFSQAPYVDSAQYDMHDFILIAVGKEK